MRKSKKILVTAGFALSMAFGVPAMPAMAMDAASVPAVSESSALDARAQLDRALESLIEYKQGAITFDVNASIPMLNGGVKGTFTFVTDPLFNGKGSVGIDVAVPGISTTHTDRMFYWQESADRFTCYYPKEDNTWAKTVMDKKEESGNAVDKLENALDTDWMKMVKNVQLGAKTGNSQTYLITIDGDKLYPYLAKLLKVETTGKKAQKDVLNQALANLGDISYDVTIDEENHLLTNFHANLTEPLRKAAEAAVKNGKSSKKEKKEMLDLINNSTLEINFHGQKLDKTPDVTVPAEISSTAKEELPSKIAELKQSIAQ